MPTLPTPIPFGKYELVDKVASGGMAEVFRACVRGEAGFEKFLAIKRILPHLSRDTEFVVMLIDEAKIAVTLNHANVVQIYDLGKVDGSYFIAMEFVEGADLKAVLLRALETGKPIPPALAVFMVMEVLKGLEYAHQKKVVSKDTRFALQIIHRDISPPNILLSYEGEVKIVDFGIAKANTRMMETSAGVLKGKFEYMSPEQAAGLEMDQRTDLFSAGLCLYEAMTGVNPFSAESDLQVIQKVRSARFPPASQINPGIPARLDLILSKALAREKEDRYKDAGEFRNDLAHAAYEAGLIATSPKLAAYMRALFKADMESGRHFVSGTSLPDPREHRGKGVQAGPYHRAPEANAGDGPAAPSREGRENRTVLRMEPEASPPPKRGRRPSGERPPTRGEPPRRPQTRPGPRQSAAPAVQVPQDMDAESTFLAAPSRPPKARPTLPAHLEDMDAEATFLAAPSQPPPKPQRRAAQSLLHPEAGVGGAGHPSGRSPGPRRGSPPPTETYRDLRPEVASTFLPPARGHNAPPPELLDDGTDAIETRREGPAPATDPDLPARGRASEPLFPEPESPTVQSPRDLSEIGVNRPTVTSFAPPPFEGSISTHRDELQRQPPPREAPPREAPPREAPPREAPPRRADPYGTLQSPVQPLMEEPGPVHYETTAQPPAGAYHGPTEQGERPGGAPPLLKRPVGLMGLGALLGLALGAGLGAMLGGGETEAPKGDAASQIGEVVVLAPEGARTLVDGQSVGSEYPLRLALPALRSHGLSVTMEGFEPIEHAIALEPGATRILEVSFQRGAPLSEDGGDPAQNDAP